VNHPIQTEQDLLAKLAKGEYRITGQIYKQHFGIINAWVLRNGGNEPDAADVFQEAMVILFEKSQQEEFRLSCKIGTYLFAVSKNLWYRKLNKKQFQPGLLPEDRGEGAVIDWMYEDDAKAHEEREKHYEQLETVLGQLGEPCKSLLLAFYHQNKSMVEIAVAFGYTNPDNAKTQKYKCLNRLRKLFYGTQTKTHK